MYLRDRRTVIGYHYHGAAARRFYKGLQVGRIIATTGSKDVVVIGAATFQPKLDMVSFDIENKKMARLLGRVRYRDGFFELETDCSQKNHSE